jgi:hypothetical protein
MMTLDKKMMASAILKESGKTAHDAFVQNHYAPVNTEPSTKITTPKLTHLKKEAGLE